MIFRDRYEFPSVDFQANLTITMPIYFAMKQRKKGPNNETVSIANDRIGATASLNLRINIPFQGGNKT